MRRPDHGVSNSHRCSSSPRSVDVRSRSLSTVLSRSCRLEYFEALKASNLITSSAVNVSILAATALLYPSNTSAISVSKILFCVRELSMVFFGGVGFLSIRPLHQHNCMKIQGCKLVLNVDPRRILHFMCNECRL